MADNTEATVSITIPNIIKFTLSYIFINILIDTGTSANL